MMRALPTGLAVIVTTASTFLAARTASADVATSKGPKLEVVVQSGIRGDVNHCPPVERGKPDEICFFDWDAPLANLNVKLPMKGADNKCVPHKEKLTEGLELEVGCAAVTDRANGKDANAYTFTMTLHEAGPKPHMAPKAHVVTVPKLKAGALWQVGGFKDRKRSTKGSDSEKPKRAAFLIKLKLVE